MQSQEEVYIPFEDFRRILEQNKLLQETALRLKEDNDRLVEENNRILEELEVTSALMLMLEQRNTELVTIQAKEDRNELLHHLALVEEEMVNLKSQYELVVLALDQEKATMLSKDAEIASLQRIVSDTSKDSVINCLGRRITELERLTEEKILCAQTFDHQAYSSCPALCCKSLSLCVQNDVLMLRLKSRVLALFDLLQRNRFRVASEILTEQLLSEEKDKLMSFSERIVGNNTSIVKLLHSVTSALAGGTESETGDCHENHSETLSRILGCIRDAFLIERSNLIERLNHLNIERTRMLDVYGLDIARLGQLRDDLAEQRFHSTHNLL